MPRNILDNLMQNDTIIFGGLHFDLCSFCLNILRSQSIIFLKKSHDMG